MTPVWVRRLAVLAVLLVAAVAAIISYAHQQELATAHGEDWRAWLLPLSVDGMLLAATLAIVDRRRRREPAGWVPWLGLALGIVASLLANVAAARPDGVSQIIAGWPPVALAISIETLVVVLRRPKPVADIPEPAEVPAPEPEPEPVEVATPKPKAAPAKPEPTPEALPAEHAERLAVLLAEGATSRRIAQELPVSRYRAQQYIASHSSNGAAQ